VTFHPQGWQDDNAISIDPCPTLVDVTREVLAMDKAYALAIKDNSFESDSFLNANAVPEWIRDWGGPYYFECGTAIAV